jgi:murein DD-endopeptidase MepM/ murein hydrolase activator NlpD
MSHKYIILSFFTLLTLQSCSQNTYQFKPQDYPFPIPEEEPYATMQDSAEQQAAETRRMTGDPFLGGTTLTVDLSAIPDGKWCYPLPGAKVISNYGTRGRRRHSGVDLKTRPNDKIYAAMDGIVTMSKPFAGYGNCIILRHPNGLETLYSHNSKNLVVEGQRVTAGKVIALTGRTGRATTEHLHFELRVAGKHYNPQLLFDHNTKRIKRHKLTFKKGGGVTTK